MLGEHVISAETAAFAHVKFVRPAGGLGEFLLRQAELSHAGAELRGDARIVGQEVEVALLVVHVVLEDLLALLVTPLGPAEASADVVQ